MSAPSDIAPCGHHGVVVIDRSSHFAKTVIRCDTCVDGVPPSVPVTVTPPIGPCPKCGHASSIPFSYKADPSGNPRQCFACMAVWLPGLRCPRCNHAHCEPYAPQPYSNRGQMRCKICISISYRDESP